MSREYVAAAHITAQRARASAYRRVEIQESSEAAQGGEGEEG